LILTSDIKNKLHNVTWAYEDFDRSYYNIISNLEWLITEQDYHKDSRADIIKKFLDVIKLRLENVYSKLFEMSSLVLDIKTQYYEKYYGPFKEELGHGLFNDIRRRINNSFEAFLINLKILLDISIKMAFKFVSVNLSLGKRIIDSLEKLLKEYDNSNNKSSNSIWRQINYSNLFDDFINERDQLMESKDYRDFIIHHGKIDMILDISQEDPNTNFSLQIPKIRKNGKKYYVDINVTHDLLISCRERMFVLFRLIATLTEKFFDKTLIKNHINALKKHDPKEVSLILEKLGKKDYIYDKVLDEKDLRIFLDSKGIKFDELKIEKKTSYRMGTSKKKIGVQDDFSHLVVHIFYKLGNIEIMKTEDVFDRNFKPREEWGPHYAIRISGISHDEFNKQSNLELIIKHLRGCLILYVEKINDIIIKCRKFFYECHFFIDLEKKFLKGSRTKYKQDIIKYRKKLDNSVRKYDYFVPSLIFINKDFFEN
jgi:hypothetical protein